MQRRHFLSLLAAGAGLVVTRRAAGALQPKKWRAAAPVDAGLSPGMQLGGCTLEEIQAPRMGALPLILSTAEGTRFQIDVMRRAAGGPEGVANTASLALFIHNGGVGHSPTAEAEGLGAMALASFLAARDEALAASLLTFDQRRGRFPTGCYNVLPARRPA